MAPPHSYSEALTQALITWPPAPAPPPLTPPHLSHQRRRTFCTFSASVLRDTALALAAVNKSFHHPRSWCCDDAARLPQGSRQEPQGSVQRGGGRAAAFPASMTPAPAAPGSLTHLHCFLWRSLVLFQESLGFP